MEKHFGLMAMLLAEGSLEILQLMGGKPICRFSDFVRLKNERTSKTFAKNTLSLRLKELSNLGYIKRETVEVSKDRPILAYRLTEKGKKALAISEKYEKELRKLG